MTDDVIRDFPSPVLPQEQVRQLLSDGLSGFRDGASPGGALAAMSLAAGAAKGARFGARRLKLTGQARVLSVPLSPEVYRVAHDSLAGVVSAAEPGPDSALLIGFFPAGLNPVVMQLVWRSMSVKVTAHALEGLIKQRTALKALDGMATVLGRYASAR